MFACSSCSVIRDADIVNNTLIVFMNVNYFGLISSSDFLRCIFFVVDCLDYLLCVTVDYIEFSWVFAFAFLALSIAKSIVYP